MNSIKRSKYPRSLVTHHPSKLFFILVFNSDAGYLNDQEIFLWADLK